VKLRTKFFAFFSTITLLLIVLASVAGYYWLKEQTGRNINSEMDGLVKSYVNQVELWAEAKAKLIETMEFVLRDTGKDSASYKPYLKFYEKDAELTDLYIGLTDGSFIDGTGWVPPADFVAMNRPWYQEAVKKNGLVFTEPYIDEMTKKYIVTAAIPLKNKQGNLQGVLAEDIFLTVMTDRFKEAKVRGEGYAFMLDAKGLVLAHPDEKLLGKNLLEDEIYKHVVKDMLASEYGCKSYTINNKDMIVAFRKVPSTGWIFIFVLPESIVYSELGILKVLPIIALLLIIALSWFMTVVVSRPVERLQQLMKSVELGDLTQRGVVSSINANDEIGILTHSVNNSVSQISGMIKDIYNSTEELQKGSGKLIDIATTLAANSQEMSAKTCSVSATAEEIAGTIGNTAQDIGLISKNVNDIAVATEEMSAISQESFMSAEQTSNEVRQVSAVIEEISASISRVASSALDVSGSVSSAADAVQEINDSINKVDQNCKRSINIAFEAENRSNETNQIIKKLNGSSKEIGKIVNIISSIAERTNMLALNATIEAASAGEAGRGFAVVAAEVKELAKRTSEATGQIGQQIETMQVDMVDAVEAMGKITEIIIETTGITNTIASSVTKQSKSVGGISDAMTIASQQVAVISKEIGDIADNTSHAAKNAVEASNGVKEVVEAAQKISLRSAEVAENTETVAQGMEHIACAAEEIAKGGVDISSSVQEIELASADTAIRAVDTSGSANDLSETANKLGILVERFKIESPQN